MDELITKQSDEIEAAHGELDKAQVWPGESLAQRISVLADRANSYERENGELRKLSGVCAK
jgi:hypothetical protein